MTTLPTLTSFSGTIPDKATQTKDVFASAVHVYLNYFNTTYTPQLQALVTAQNVLSTEIATAAQTATDKADIATTKANEANNSAQLAQQTIALLPNSSINDTTASYTQAYSSQKTEDRLGAKQNTLVSGTNIKSVNGQPLLGSGDLVISANQFVVGDMIQSAGNRTAPSWLPCNGNSYNTTTYASLYAKIGKMPAFYPLTSTVTAGGNSAGGISRDGLYVAYTLSASPYLSILYWNGSSFTTCSITTNTSTTCQYGNKSFTSTGTYMLHADGNGTIELFTRTATTTFNKTSSVTDLGGTAYKCAWTMDDNYAIFPSFNAPYLGVYSRSAGTLTKLTVPANATESTGFVASNGSDIYTIGATKVFRYSVSGSTVTYVGSYTHGCNIDVTSSRGYNSEAVVSANGKFLFIPQPVNTADTGSKRILYAVLDTTNGTVSRVKLDHGDADVFSTQLNLSSIRPYFGFYRSGNNVIGFFDDYGTTKATIFNCDGDMPVKMMSFSVGGGDFINLAGYPTLVASDTSIVVSPSGSLTNNFRTELGAYLPRKTSTYINTGL